MIFSQSSSLVFLDLLDKLFGNWAWRDTYLIKPYQCVHVSKANICFATKTHFLAQSIDDTRYNEFQLQISRKKVITWVIPKFFYIKLFPFVLNCQ